MAIDNRFDYRSKETFKKDIAFATALENYFFTTWTNKFANSDNIVLVNWNDNGCGNDGKFIKSGSSTFGADFIVSMFYNHKYYDNLPLEMKWVPTAGKFTLKRNDLAAYVKEKAAILFVYNTNNCGIDMRKPKDYNLDTHIKRIEKKSKDLKWGIMFPETVENILSLSNRFKPIHYMGGKQGIVIRDSEFNDFFDQHNW